MMKLLSASYFRRTTGLSTRVTVERPASGLMITFRFRRKDIPVIEIRHDGIALPPSKLDVVYSQSASGEIRQFLFKPSCVSAGVILNVTCMNATTYNNQPNIA